MAKESLTISQNTHIKKIYSNSKQKLRFDKKEILKQALTSIVQSNLLYFSILDSLLSKHLSVYTDLKLDYIN